LTETYSGTNPSGTIHVATETTMYINSVEVAPEEVPKVKLGVRDFDKASATLFLGYEGAMVRLFKWNGQVFFSTHRRIDASRSNWGGRTSFFELYKKLGGPEIDTFFGAEPYSPFCYMLLVAHNEIRLATSTRDNRIIFIGVKKVWDEEKYASEGKPYSWSGELKPKIPSIPVVNQNTFSTNLDHSMIVQPSVDVATANKFLFPNQFAKDIPTTNEAAQYNAKDHEILVDYNDAGNAVNEVFFKRLPQRIADEKLAGGDFIILYTKSADGNTIVYRLESPAFQYRVEITGNDPNLYHRFAVEMVNFYKAEPKTLKDTYPQYISDQGLSLSLDQPNDRQIYWWSLFYDAVPPSYKDEVDTYFKRYDNDINKVATFIMSEYPRIIRMDSLSEELKRMNENTKRRFEDLRTKALASAHANGQSPHTAIRNMLFKETGPSLYKMISTVRNLEKLKNTQAKAVQQLSNDISTLQIKA